MFFYQPKQCHGCLFFAVRRTITERCFEEGEKKRSALTRCCDRLDNRCLHSFLNIRRDEKTNRCDDVNVPRNERRSHVGDRKVTNADHLEIIQCIRGKRGKVSQSKVNEIADLDNTTGVFFVFDDLERKERVMLHSPPHFQLLRRGSLNRSTRGE